jgi:hypothetical protein
MEGGVVDEVDVDVRRFVILTIFGDENESGGTRDKEATIVRTSDLFVYSTKSCVGHDRTQKRG